ncbi:MAG TPA: type II toxin-antitoxin system prevent-host-death family antitoxin [Bryobacteraceae bacterium]|nr:type II toxin-antitoxin system prevent-host-death family antitoxin [Bryobacteraceae bacterium]
MAVSEFKATCQGVIEDVRKTRRPVRITNFGKAVAELVPAKPAMKSWLGCTRDSTEVASDIVGPVGAFDNWKDDEL